MCIVSHYPFGLDQMTSSGFITFIVKTVNGLYCPNRIIRLTLTTVSAECQITKVVWFFIVYSNKKETPHRIKHFHKCFLQTVFTPYYGVTWKNVETNYYTQCFHFLSRRLADVCLQFIKIMGNRFYYETFVFTT